MGVRLWRLRERVGLFSAFVYTQTASCDFRNVKSKIMSCEGIWSLVERHYENRWGYITSFLLPMTLPKMAEVFKISHWTGITLCCLGKLLIWIILLKLLHIQLQQLISLNLIIIIWQVFPNNNRGLTNEAHPNDLNRRFSTCSEDDRFHLLCTLKNGGF